VYRHVIDTPLNGGLSTTWLSRCWGLLIDAVEHHRHEVHRCRAACPWGLSADVNDMGLLQHGGVDRAPVWGSSTSLSSCPRLLWRTWERRRNAIETHPNSLSHVREVEEVGMAPFDLALVRPSQRWASPTLRGVFRPPAGNSRSCKCQCWRARGQLGGVGWQVPARALSME